MQNSLIDLLFKDADLYSYGQEMLKGSSLLIEKLWDSPKALLAAYAQKILKKNVLIITGDSKEENLIYDDLDFFFDGPLHDFPAWETLPSENIPPSPDIVGRRYSILKELIDKKEQHIVVSSVQACLQKILPQERIERLFLSLRKGQEIAFEILLEKIVEMGYQRKAIASDKGEFAVRGGIIDVFGINTPEPVRIEFWGDEIESLRRYDPIGQRSVEEIDQLDLTPALEHEWLDGKLASISDYLGHDPLIIFDDILAIEDRFAGLKSYANCPHFDSFEDLLNRLKKYQKIYFCKEEAHELGAIKKQKSSKHLSFKKISFDVFSRQEDLLQWNAPFQRVCPEQEDIFEHLQKSMKHYQIFCLYNTNADYEHLKEKLLEIDCEYFQAYLSSGFSLQNSKILLLPTTEFSKRPRLRRQKQRSTFHSHPSTMHELVPGDYVVHLNTGIGKFLGTEKQSIAQKSDEFFVIEFADQAKMYVPFSQAHLISKYIGGREDEKPKLHQIGSSRWKKTKEQTERNIMGYACDLLHLYAKRKMKSGYRFPEDSSHLFSFENDFLYEETEDQISAIADIKEDMCSNEPMDRLVCGDVGYGKTEVAMRAAFKAVDAGKQVAVLVPTTVLAMQHYETFLERMWNFAVKVDVLSRFRTSKEIKKTLEALEQGSIDILIGTHRILGKDVQYKNLGLLIIDEEQRFGVRAKEKLKSFKDQIDCLSLSATPIPRTLYMSLFGARDLSVIATPPQDRLPIKTIVCESDEKVIKEAITRELNRDGQIYIIHNRVETLDLFADKIRKLAGGAPLITGHGQMSSDELDEVFHSFKNGIAKILVATTIVESGIDIPNANTIIVDRADRFGLADLYQLRGRVGRWNRRAYAYFLTPPKRQSSEIAKKRLQALIEAGTVHGGGMKIAMRDLEIRGAGSILGTEQSGHISSIGFHFYCKLLQRTIATLRGKLPSSLCDTKMEFCQDARLPEEYINESALRLEFYQKFGEALSYGDAEKIMTELNDRFGSPPIEVQWLYRLSRLRIFASLNHIHTLKIKEFSIHIESNRKGKVLSKKMFFQKAKDPEDLETKILKLLKNFKAEVS